jgi:hypothetical protein
MKLFELGTIVTDSATGIKGALVSAQLLGDTAFYYLQPAALDPETGTPVHRVWIEAVRVSGGKMVETDLPIDFNAVLNTEVEDIITGLKGTVVGAYVMMNGCLHLRVQPHGVIRKNGAIKEVVEIDYRMLKGPKLKLMSKAALVKDRKARPSPERIRKLI